MAEYILQGKKGSGKGIIAVGMIKDRLDSGRPVATNLDLRLDHLLGPSIRDCHVYRIPDEPTLHDLNALGRIDTGGDESKNGLLVLDECANWLNTRDYKDGNRKEILDWFLHSRKFGWDVIYIIQDIGMLDKQFRDGFGEHVITALRLDRLSIPLVGWIIRVMGFAGRLPKFHVGVVRYGQSPLAPVVERKIYRGGPFYKAYDTLQRFSRHNEFQGVSCTLSGWHVAGRYMGFWRMHRKMLLSGLFSGFVLAALLIGAGGFFLGFRLPQIGPQVASTKITGFYQTGDRVVAFLEDGRSLSTHDFRQTPEGLKVIYQGQIFVEGRSK